MIQTIRDTDPQNCAGKNCPGLHFDDQAGTVTIEGALAGTPAGLTPGPGEGFVTMRLDVAARIVADAKERGLL